MPINAQLSSKKVSVIVPVRNSDVTLRSCICALDHLCTVDFEIEIIIVDNGHNQNLRQIVIDYPKIRLERELKRGSYAARNRGLAAASGNIIAFTDADCLPEPTWLIEAVGALIRRQGTIVGGKVVAFCDGDARDRLNVYEVWEEAHTSLFRQSETIELTGHAVTANLTAYRDVFDRIGFFDQELNSGSDRKWAQKAIENGEVLVFEPKAVVHHPRRSTFVRNMRKLRRTSGGLISRLKAERLSFFGFCKEIYQGTIIDAGYLSNECKRSLTDANFTKTTDRIRYFSVAMALGLVALIEKLFVACGKRAYTDR